MNKLILFCGLLMYQSGYAMMNIKEYINQNDWVQISSSLWNAKRDEAVKITKLLIDSHEDLNIEGMDKSYLLKDLLVYLKIPVNILITEEKNNQYETMRIVIKELVKYGKLDPKIPFVERVKLHKSDRILKALCQSICDEISKD